MSNQPNIVIFNPDSYRGDVLGHLGNSGAVTPNLDAVIRDGGVSYANAFAQNPVCTPSRCSFMTGWYPHVHGYRSMINMLKEHEPNLFAVLRREGYHVWWGGKNDLFAVEKWDDYLKHCDTKYRPAACPNEYRMPPPLDPDDPRKGVYYEGVMTREGNGNPFHDHDQAHVLGAVDFIGKADGDQPFCVYLPLTFPHPAYKIEKPFYDSIDPAGLPPRLPVPENDYQPLHALRNQCGSANVSEDDWVDIKRIYYAMCMKIDHLFGLVVDALKQNHLYDNTLIIFLSDHGDFAGDYALPEKTHLSLQDALIRAPLIIKPPASCEVQPGVRTHLAELIDMPATIYDLLDIEPGYAHYGRSLVESLRGDHREIRDAIFAEVGSRAGEQAFKNPEVKSLPPDSFYGRQSRAAVPAHDAGTYAVCCRTQDFKYVRRGYNDHHELFDLRTDPGELNNLSSLPEHADLEKTMETRLLDFFMNTADVLPHKQDSRQV
ncbi:sulfatase-like hydrolase/transferase [Verrucomicrobiota bacterium]